MTKADLVDIVANAAELTKKDVERLVEIVFESIIESLNSGEKIEVAWFQELSRPGTRRPPQSQSENRPAG